MYDFHKKKITSESGPGNIFQHKNFLKNQQ